MGRSLRSKHAHRRTLRPSTLKHVRARIKVHRHHHRRYAGVGVAHRSMVKRAAKGRTKQALTASGHRRHPHKGWHGHRKRHPGHILRKRTGHRRKGYHLKHPRKRGYHLKHKRRYTHHRKGYHLKHKVARRHGYHIHRRKGLKHPHKGWHGHRNFKHHNTWHRKASRPQPTPVLSPASYLSMF